MQNKLPKRMWVNHPSVLQPYHHLHGTNVLAVHEYGDTYRIFFFEGVVESQQISGLALSPGFHCQTSSPRKED